MSEKYDKEIEKYLGTLLERIGDGNDKIREVKQEVEALKKEYEKERDAPVKNPDFEQYQKDLAEALPGITKGTLDAVAAFQQSPPDIIVGSAAVVDIAASLASTLGGLSALGGPPGALLGALFSTVSMILGFFAPQPPSLISQIKEMLDELRAETEKSQIKAAEEAVLLYKDTCEKYMKPGQPDPKTLTRALQQFNLAEGNTITAIRTVRDWLRQEDSQELDGWPELLNLQCQVYMHLMLAVTRQNLYANDKAAIEEYVGNPPDPQKQHDWELLQLETGLKNGDIERNNVDQRTFLKEILPVARGRGTIVLSVAVGTSTKVFAATGKAVRNGTWGDPLFNHCRRVSVVPPRDGADHPNARYDIWALDTTADRYAFHGQLLVRSRKRINTLDVGGVGTGLPWLDVWPLPGAPNMFEIYAARSLKEGGALGVWTWSPDDPRKVYFNKDWMPYDGKRMLNLRIAQPSRWALPDDPDGPAVNAEKMFYATLENSREVFVRQDYTGQATVPVPMASYNGVAVDRYCLWVFGNEGLVCATHASIQAYVLKKRAAPNWLGPPRNNKTPVLDLCACGDGTLTLYRDGDLSSGLYRIDFTQQDPRDRFTVEWESLTGLRWAHQVQKLPVLGWPLLEAAIESLNTPAKDLVRPSFRVR